MAAPNPAPIFTIVPRIEVSQLGDISTTRESVSPTSIFTAGSHGSRIERVTVMSKTPRGNTNTAHMIWFCIYDGSDWAILEEQLIAAVTPDDAVGGAYIVFNFAARGGLILFDTHQIGLGYRAYASADDDLYVTVEGGDF